MIHTVASCTCLLMSGLSYVMCRLIKWEDCLEVTLCGLCVVFDQVPVWVQCERVLVQWSECCLVASYHKTWKWSRSPLSGVGEEQGKGQKRHPIGALRLMFQANPTTSIYFDEWLIRVYSDDRNFKFYCWTSTTLALKFPVGNTAWDIVVVPRQFCHCLGTRSRDWRRGKDQNLMGGERPGALCKNHDWLTHDSQWWMKFAFILYILLYPQTCIIISSSVTLQNIDAHNQSNTS